MSQSNGYAQLSTAFHMAGFALCSIEILCGAVRAGATSEESFIMSAATTSVFAVENMSCEHCAARVTKAVKALAPGSEVQVDLPTGAVTVAPAAVDPQAMAKAISDAGYPARLAENMS
jgi:copper chaperone